MPYLCLHHSIYSYSQCCEGGAICHPFTDEDAEAQRGDLTGEQAGEPRLDP